MGNLHTGIENQADAGAKAFRAEIRDLGTGTADHITAGIWFCYRWVWERYRNRRTAKRGDGETRAAAIRARWGGLGGGSDGRRRTLKPSPLPKAPPPTTRGR